MSTPATATRRASRCSCCGDKLANQNQAGLICPECQKGEHALHCAKNTGAAPESPAEALPSQTPAPASATAAEPEPAEEPAQDQERPTVETPTAAALVPLDASELPARSSGQAMTTSRGLELRSLEEIWRFSGFVIASGLVPSGIANREAAFLAVEMGLELGMPPMMALQNIGVINGRPAPYGHAVKGMVEASGKMESYQELFEGEFPKDTFRAVVISKRFGREPLRTEFSIDDAKVAKLWGKVGASGKPTPWVTHPKRMLMWRARQFNQHDNFPDVTRGFRTFEELQDEPIEAQVVPMPQRKSEASAS